MTRWMAALPLMMTIAACGAAPGDADRAVGSEAPENAGVSLRNLADTEVAAPAPDRFTVRGRPIPTPSDTRSRYVLLRNRAAIGGTVIAIIRQERDGRVAYARAEVDCDRRLFHVLGVASSRALVETHVDHDGALRSIAGLPLRQELATFVCQAAGTPLASG